MSKEKDRAKTSDQAVGGYVARGDAYPGLVDDVRQYGLEPINEAIRDMQNNPELLKDLDIIRCLAGTCNQLMDENYHIQGLRLGQALQIESKRVVDGNVYGMLHDDVIHTDAVQEFSMRINDYLSDIVARNDFSEVGDLVEPITKTPEAVSVLYAGYRDGEEGLLYGTDYLLSGLSADDFRRGTLKKVAENSAKRGREHIINTIEEILKKGDQDKDAKYIRSIYDKNRPDNEN